MTGCVSLPAAGASLAKDRAPKLRRTVIKLTANKLKITKDLTWATSANFVEKAVGYLVIVMLTRYLTKEQMGQFFFASTLALFFALIPNAGINSYLFRDVSTKGKGILKEFSETFSLRLALSVVYLVAINVFITLYDPALFTVVLLTAIYIILEQLSQSFGVLFLGLKHAAYDAVAKITGKLALLAAIYAVINMGRGLNGVLAAYIVANSVLILLGAGLVWHFFGRLQWRWRPAANRQTLRLSWPFFAVTILSLVHLKVDTLLLGFLGTYADVATYEAAFKFLEVSRVAIRPFGMIFFPIAAERAAQGRWWAFRRLTRRLWLATVGLGILVALVVVAGAAYIVPAVFGPKYDDPIPVLRVLFLSVPILYLGMLNMFLATALHLERKVVGGFLLSVIVGVALNLFAIPRWGVMGAAWIVLITESILAFWVLRLILQAMRERRIGAAGMTAVAPAAPAEMSAIKPEVH
jgi:O-antigen/teichoic acid export membrane protein